MSLAGNYPEQPVQPVQGDVQAAAACPLADDGCSLLTQTQLGDV